MQFETRSIISIKNVFKKFDIVSNSNSHNYRYPHEHERIFFVTMYNRNAFVVLSLNRKLIFFQPLTNSIAPSLFHTRKNGGSKVNPQ